MILCVPINTITARSLHPHVGFLLSDTTVVPFTRLYFKAPHRDVLELLLLLKELLKSPTILLPLVLHMLFLFHTLNLYIFWLTVFWYVFF
jgi:hypothetical protein